MASTDIDCRLVINQQNSGSVFKQWQKGVDLAIGDYIWICEADDFAKPEFIQKSIGKFADKDLVLCYTQSLQVNEDGSLLDESYLEYTNDISQHKWRQDYVCDGLEELSRVLAIKNTIPNVSAVVFRKTSIMASLKRCRPLLEKLKIAGDWLIYTDMLQHGRIAFTAESLNAHRRHGTSVTNNKTNNCRHMAEILFMQNRISKIAGVDPITRQKARNFEQHAFHYLGLAKPGVEDPGQHPEVKAWLGRLTG